MRLHIPDHLQKDFQTLMSLAFDLKKTNPQLRRNVKFDEETLGLFMDLQTDKDGDWKRVKPDQARRALSRRPKGKEGPTGLEDDEILSLLGGSTE